jgi:MurNAc alpha-1-phosphate uridylyltransferase
MALRIRRAMLFAAGLGTRMRPLTDHCPKPLVLVAGKPLLDYALERFEEHGIERVVVNTHYLAGQIVTHLARRKHRCEVVLSHEATLLETGGGIVHALPALGNEPFFSANADAFWCDAQGSSALRALESQFARADLDALLVMAERRASPGYHGPGNFSVADDGSLRWDPDGHVFTGLQVLNPRWFADKPATPFSLRTLYQEATEPSGVLRRVRGQMLNGRFMHVGTPAELNEVEAALRTQG